MAITRYIGDRFISTSSSDTYPVDVLEGAQLYSIPLNVGYSFSNNAWNPVASGINGLVSGRQSNTIYNMGTQWTGSWNIWNNGDLIGFGFNSNNPAPLSKGHFYSEPSGFLAGWVTGIILENQSNTGALEDWGALTVMTDSGDWGNLTAATTSGDWGNILDPTTPGISIDIKLSQNRTTISALRFKRLVSGSSNLDSTVEFWVTDSGTLLPKFWIQSGQFLPWLSGGNYFLGAPNLPFSGIHSLKAVLKQLQFDDSVIPSTGNLLSSTSGQLYWSGKNLALLSGVTENGVITYNEDYPNAVVQTGVIINNDKLGIGITPSFTVDVNASNAVINLNSTSSITQIFMPNSVNTKCNLTYSGYKFETRVGSASIPTITVVTGQPGRVGFANSNEPRSDVELLKNNIGETQDSMHGLYIRNDISATGATGCQHSPPITLRGSFWNPTGLNSVTTDFRMYVSGASGRNPLVSGSGILIFEGQTGGAGYKELMKLDYDAGIKLASNRTWNSGVVFADHMGGLMEASGMSFDTGKNILQIKTISGNQARYTVGGTINSNTTSISTNGAVADLMTYTLPANVLRSNGDRLELYAGGQFNNGTSGPKRLICEAFNTKIIDISNVPPGNNNGWILKSTLYRWTIGGAIIYDHTFYTGSTNAAGGLLVSMLAGQSASGTASNNGVIRFRGQSGIDQYNMFINYYPANDDN